MGISKACICLEPKVSIMGAIGTLERIHRLDTKKLVIHIGYIYVKMCVSVVANFL